MTQKFSALLELLSENHHGKLANTITKHANHLLSDASDKRVSNYIFSLTMQMGLLQGTPFNPFARIGLLSKKVIETMLSESFNEEEKKEVINCLDQMVIVTALDLEFQFIYKALETIDLSSLSKKDRSSLSLVIDW